MINLSLPREEQNQYYLEESTFIEEIDGLQLWRLGNNEFNNFNEFIFRVYSDAFGDNGGLPFTFSDIETQSSIYFSRTKVCGIKHPDGTGSIRRLSKEESSG